MKRAINFVKRRDSVYNSRILCVDNFIFSCACLC